MQERPNPLGLIVRALVSQTHTNSKREHDLQSAKSTMRCEQCTRTNCPISARMEVSEPHGSSKRATHHPDTERQQHPACNGWSLLLLLLLPLLARGELAGDDVVHVVDSSSSVSCMQ